MKQTQKFYLALPVLVLPFVTILFWTLGGGSEDAHASPIASSGLNSELPTPQFRDDPDAWDKLALYERARRDSIAEREAKKNDPYFRFSTLTELQDLEQQRLLEQNKINASLGKKDLLIQSDEQQVEQRLTQLYKAINSPTEVTQTEPSGTTPSETASITTDVDRLEKLMENINDGHEENPELKQMDVMLDKILDIQHPDRMREKIEERKAEQSKDSYAVSVADNLLEVTTLQSSKGSLEDSIQTQYDTAQHRIAIAELPPSPNDFFGLEDEMTDQTYLDNTIDAVIHDTQTLVSGSMIKLRLTNDVTINNTLVPAHTLLYGIVAVNGERLSIDIASIRNGHTILPVTLTVYDLDGMQGIYIPGAIERDAAKQATGESLDQMQLMNTMDTSLGVQAASAGIEAVKGLFSKKVKLVKVTVKAGYQILLKDASTKS